MKRLIAALLVTLSWAILAVVAFGTVHPLVGALALLLACCSVYVYFTEGLIEGQRKRIEHERSRGDAWQREYDDLRVLGLVEMNRLEDLNAQFLAEVRGYRGEGPL